MLSENRILREHRASLLSHAQKLIPGPGGTWTPETRRQFDGLMSEHDAATRDLELIEGSGKPPDASIITTEHAQMKKYDARAAFARHSHTWFNALRDYFLRGDGMSQDSRAILNGDRKEFRDMGVTPGGAGGFFVPQGFVYDVEEALKYYGPMLMTSEIMPTATGAPMPYPTDNDTTIVGERIGEGQQVTTADVSLGQIVFGAYKYSTKMVKCSIELLQDSAFDFDVYLKKKFAFRLGRILNTELTLGTGVSMPKGIIPAATVGVGGSSGISVIGDDNANTPDPTQQVGYLDLTNLVHSVDPLYRLDPSAGFMMHDQTLRYIKTLKDKFGRPLWIPGLSAEVPDTILGFRYWINNDMDQLATGKKTVIFGALSKYLVRQVRELAILKLVERFADYGQIAFIGFARYDGNLLDAGTHPVKYLQQA